MKLTLLGLAYLGFTVSGDRISKKQAASVFSRSRRDNGGIFEEMKSPNLERECIEESCSFQELLEATSSQDEAEKFWKKATAKCSEAGACNNSGTKTCVNKWNARECICKPGYQNTEEFDDCSQDVDECAEEGFCANGGQCTNTFGGFECTCAEGWEGDRCEQDKDECLDNPCQNDGQCTNTEGSFECACNEFWEGDLCDVDINECLNSPCGDFDCINNQGSYECLCTGGAGGKHCDEKFNECDASLCPAGTECQLIGDSDYGAFQCICPERGCNNLDESIFADKQSRVWVDIVETEVEYVDATNTNATDYDSYDVEEEVSETQNYDTEEYGDNEEEVPTYDVVEAEEPAYDSEEYGDNEAEDPTYEVEAEEPEYEITDYEEDPMETVDDNEEYGENVVDLPETNDADYNGYEYENESVDPVAPTEEVLDGDYPSYETSSIATDESYDSYE